MNFNACLNSMPAARGWARACALLTLLLLGACGAEISPPEMGSAITISDAWVRQVPPQAKMTAAYLKMENSGQKSRRITGVSSPEFGSVSLHQTTMTDGVMRMRPANDVTIDAGSSLSFEPGGLHLMLGMRSDEAAESGEIELLFSFADGETVSTRAAIQAQSDE